MKHILILYMIYIIIVSYLLLFKYINIIMDLNNIKKQFNDALPNINFFNEFTLQDVELGKKKLYNKLIKTQNQDDVIQYIDEISNLLIKDKFNLNNDVIIKNTVKDPLIPIYNNTIERITQIDSQYRNDFLNNETSFICNLTDKLTNITSIKMQSISIPYSFYNIEQNQGNNVFIFNNNVINIPDGYYNKTQLINAINIAINENLTTLILNQITGKISIEVNGTYIFYDPSNPIFNNTSYNNSLGWILGCRHYNNNISEIVIENRKILDNIFYIPEIKYLVVTLDDYNQNQSNKSLVQLQQNQKSFIKPNMYHNENSHYYRKNSCITSYPISKKKPDCIDDLNIDNLNDKDLENIKLTKKQLYSTASINSYKNEINHTIKQDHIPNILAIVPLEYKNQTWSETMLFSDKNSYIRSYHSPVDIEKLNITIYDDKSNILNLNGQEWSMTLITNHIYKF